MAERAAHLTDRVLPAAPVRQWVLTVPHRLRYLMAWDHRLCRAVLGVYVRVLLGWYRRRAKRRGIADGRSGAVTAIQRFGGAMNLHVHFHTLALDGVFARGADGVLGFYPQPPPTDAEVAAVLRTIRRRIVRLLERRGLAEPAEEGMARDVGAELSPVLALVGAGAVQGRQALGPAAGQRIEQFVEQTLQEWMGLTVNRDKTRTAKLHEPGVGLNFLGYTFRYDRDRYDRQRRYLHLTVSEPSLQRVRDRLKEMTRANQSFTPLRPLIERIHRMLRGWQSYFSQGHLSDAYRDVDSYTQRRLIAHLRRRSQRAYRKPAGVTWWDHLQRLGWTPLQKRVVKA